MFGAPRGPFLRFPESWVWDVGLESRLIADGERPLALSLVPPDDWIQGTGEAQSGQRSPLSQSAGAPGLDLSAQFPVQAPDALPPQGGVCGSVSWELPQDLADGRDDVITLPPERPSLTERFLLCSRPRGKHCMPTDALLCRQARRRD